MVSLVSNTGLTESQQKYIDYYITYFNDVEVKVKDLLDAGTKQTLKVIVKFKEDITAEDLVEEDPTLNLNFEVTYVQADGTATPVPKDYPDPDKCVAQINDKTYLTLEDALTSAVDDDTIIMIDDTTETVVNNRNVTLNLNGFTITGLNDPTITNRKSLTIIGNGTLDILNADIKASNYGIYASSGTVNIGTNEGEIVANKPVIVGDTYGVYIGSGKVNFYDGVIKGKTDSYRETFNAIADNSEIAKYEEEINTETYIATSLTEQKSIVKNNDTEYLNLQTAIDEATSGDTLTFIDNANIYYTVTLPEDKIINIDINGYNVVMAKSITNNGITNISDTATTKGSISIITDTNLLINNNQLTLQDTVLSNDITESYIISGKAGSTTNLENTTIKGISGVQILSTAKGNFQNSNIELEDPGNYIYCTGTMTLNVGTFTNTSPGDSTGLYYYTNEGPLSINDANISGYTAMYINTTQNFEINNSVITGTITNTAKHDSIISESKINGSFLNQSSEGTTIITNNTVLTDINSTVISNTGSNAILNIENSIVKEKKTKSSGVIPAISNSMVT